MDNLTFHLTPKQAFVRIFFRVSRIYKKQHIFIYDLWKYLIIQKSMQGILSKAVECKDVFLQVNSSTIQHQVHLYKCVCLFITCPGRRGCAISWRWPPLLPPWPASWWQRLSLSQKAPSRTQRSAERSSIPEAERQMREKLHFAYQKFPQAKVTGSN